MVSIEYLDLKFPEYSYTIDEIVDDIFGEKLDDEIKNFAKNKTGIDKVYKSFDLRKIDVNGTDYIKPDVKLNDLFELVAKKALESAGKNPNDIGLLTILSSNQQYLMPAPTVEMVSRLGLSSDVRTQNIQGLACSSFSEGVRSAAGHFALGLKGDALVLISQYTTEWYLNIVRLLDKISITNKKDFYSFVYFVLFSDTVGAAIISNDDDRGLVKIDAKSIFSQKETNHDNYKNAKVELKPNTKHRVVFDLDVNPGLLQKNVAELSLENINQIKTKFPTDFANVKFWGLHTASKSFVDYVRERCSIEPEKTQLTYDVMRNTGNTGSVSSLQLIKESIDKKILTSGDIGGIVDYGWEGCDSFLYYVQ
jgi:3-oxoacyl-[acyl-carrier-protein] synthase III